MPDEQQLAAVDCLGIGVARLGFEAFLAWFDAHTRPGGPAVTLALVNAHTVNLAYADRGFREVLNGFSLVLNDGVGLEIYGHLAGRPFLENFNGTDLFPRVFAHRTAARDALRVFLFGARPGVAALAARNIEARYPAVRVVGVRDGYSSDHDQAELLEAINDARPHLLLVALGNPLQEHWIADHQAQLQVGIACGVGALLDFLSESIPRAPRWLRRCRLEWLYRLWLEPRRMMKRYVLGNPLFLLRAAGYRLFGQGGR